MTYAISDIHNDYESFLTMLEKIEFNPQNDRLYIIGDIFDRGGFTADPYSLYQMLSKTSAMVPILGNHEKWLKEYLAEVLSKETSQPYYYNTYNLLCEKMNINDLKEFHDWINTFPIQLEIEVSDNKILLAHAQTQSPKVADDTNDDYFLMGNHLDFEYLKNGIDGYISVFGHISTERIRYWYGSEQTYPYEIWINKKQNVCAIDCGNAYRGTSGNRLGCIRLDDLQCFYV